MSTLDQETKQELSDGEEVANLIQSRGWGIIYGKLSDRVLDLQNINNLETDKPLETQLLGRKMAVAEIWAWLNNDVFGYVEQQKINSEALKDSEDSNYITRT
jgi:hypothetical protein